MTVDDIRKLTLDEVLVERPRKWDIKFIRKFMFFFGFHSSLFNIMSFYLLHWHLKLSAEAFRTGWFLESSVTQVLILLMVRTPKPFLKSRPGFLLILSSMLVILVAILLPLTLHNDLFNFVSIDTKTVFYLLSIIGLYIVTAELLKMWFYHKWPTEKE